MNFTAGSYTEDEPSFPRQNNLFLQKIKESGVNKVAVNIISRVRFVLKRMGSENGFRTPGEGDYVRVTEIF